VFATWLVVNVVSKGLLFIVGVCGNPLKLLPNVFGLGNTPPLLGLLADQSGATKNF
jgi:hypothetical protein